MTEQAVHPGILCAALMNAFFPPASSQLTLDDHPEGGYNIEGLCGFKSFIGSPSRSPSLEAFAAECERVWQEYRNHLWKRLQETAK